MYIQHAYVYICIIYYIYRHTCCSEPWALCKLSKHRDGFIACHYRHVKSVKQLALYPDLQSETLNKGEEKVCVCIEHDMKKEAAWFYFF